MLSSVDPGDYRLTFLRLLTTLDLDISAPKFAHVTNDPMEEEGANQAEVFNDGLLVPQAPPVCLPLDGSGRAHTLSFWIHVHADKHYITILMQAEIDGKQTAKNMEPHKCEGWSWVPWAELKAREDMFTPLLHLTHSSFRPVFI